MEIEIPKMQCARCECEGPPWEFLGRLGRWPYRECPQCESVDVRVVVELVSVDGPSELPSVARR